MKINFDTGYSFGKGVFETIKIVDKKPLFLQAHLDRLENSLKFFQIKKEIKKDEIYEYIISHKKDNFALKILVSEDNLILTSREDKYLTDYSKYRLRISETQRNSTSKLIYHKSLCYYENILEHNLAIEEGFDASLFLNERGEITETSFANIFFVKDSTIFTPSSQCGLLKGTMRDHIAKNYNVKETIIKDSDLDTFSECFISNSLMGVRSVESIDNIEYLSQNMYKEILNDLKPIGF